MRSNRSVRLIENRSNKTKYKYTNKNNNMNQ